MRFSIIIPAFNEESYLPSTLAAIRDAAIHLEDTADVEAEVIVVDNNSSDETAGVARTAGANVVLEPLQGISRARNTGAANASGEVFIFIDADVIIPQSTFWAINQSMSDPRCVGGGVDVDYRPRRRLVRAYLRAWRVLGQLTDMVQGATQFCRRDVFEEVGGYDETAWIGEDVDFYWDLKRHAKRNDGVVELIREPKVVPSSRRFDKWPLWRILVWTNPLFIATFRRWKRFWGGWYTDAVR